MLNISTYKFVALDCLAQLREQLLGQCQTLQLKGTILIADEGINLFLAGDEEPVRRFLAWLKADPRFSDLDP